MKIRDVSDLTVYKVSLELLKELYEFFKLVPISEIDTIRQSKRCGKSIPANIAEGFAKRFYSLEFKRFLLIALGSSDELVTHLRTFEITTPRLSTKSQELQKKYVDLSKKLNSLHQNWDINKFLTR